MVENILVIEIMLALPDRNVLYLFIRLKLQYRIGNLVFNLLPQKDYKFYQINFKTIINFKKLGQLWLFVDSRMNKKA